jgi:hypothetical protein
MSKRRRLPAQIRKIESIDRKTGKTAVRYELRIDGGVNPATGRRQQVKRRYATERAARDALAEIGVAASQGTFVARKHITVEELCADWLASRHNARPTTVAHYKHVLAPLRQQFGSLPAQRLTRPDLDTLLIALRDGGTMTALGEPRRPWEPRSLNAPIDAWQRVLAYGVTRGELVRNEAADIVKVERIPREMQTFDAKDIKTVLAAADRSPIGHLWYLALSGLRRGEIAGLRWCDIDLEDGTPNTLCIVQNRVRAGSVAAVGECAQDPVIAAHTAAGCRAGRSTQARQGAPGAGQATARSRLCRQRLCRGQCRRHRVHRGGDHQRLEQVA